MASASLRRVAAIFLPDLLCEIADREMKLAKVPFAVAEATEAVSKDRDESLDPGRVILAVNDPARRCGVYRGQKIAQARALVANLIVRGIRRDDVVQALGEVADVALGFAPAVALSLSDADPRDDAFGLNTVWADLTGSAHLFGGEQTTLMEIVSRMHSFGHRARVAVADGPHLARAAALRAASPETVVPVGEGKRMIQSLPMDVLPLSQDTITWLARIGILSVGDLAKLPAKAASVRLGDHAARSLELASGRDDTALVVHTPSCIVCERMIWDEPSQTLEPLLFGARRLLARLCARLEGRGEAARGLQIVLEHDVAVAKLRGKAERLTIQIDFPLPLFSLADLFRIIKSKFERVHLEAPVEGMSISVTSIARARRTQLVLGCSASAASDPRALSVVVAELSVEVGSGNVGLLGVVPVHRPEAQTSLTALHAGRASNRFCTSVASNATGVHPSVQLSGPTRLLPHPIKLRERPAVGVAFSIEHHLFTVKAVTHWVRIDQVEWWTNACVRRDYACCWFASAKGCVEAWIYIERTTGNAFLHGYYD
jgi:protein ImuB